MVNLRKLFILNPGIKIPDDVRREFKAYSGFPNEPNRSLENREVARLVTLSRRLGFSSETKDDLSAVNMLLEAEGVDPYEYMKGALDHARNNPPKVSGDNPTQILGNITQMMMQMASRGISMDPTRKDLETYVKLACVDLSKLAESAVGFLAGLKIQCSDMLFNGFALDANDLSQGRDFLLPLVPGMDVDDETFLHRFHSSVGGLAFFRSQQILWKHSNIQGSHDFNRVGDSGDSHIEKLGFKTVEEFFDDMSDGNVLDLGSGAAKLAKASAVLGSPAKIYSLNPVYELHKVSLRSDSSCPTIDGVPDSEEKRRALEECEERYLGQSWEEPLPFEDGSVRRVYSCHAFPKFASTFAETRKVLKEIHRVLEDGGQLRVTPVLEDVYDENDLFAPSMPKYMGNFIKIATEDLGDGKAFNLIKKTMVGKVSDSMPDHYTLVLEKA